MDVTHFRCCEIQAFNPSSEGSSDFTITIHFLWKGVSASPRGCLSPDDWATSSLRLFSIHGVRATTVGSLKDCIDAAWKSSVLERSLRRLLSDTGTDHRRHDRGPHGITGPAQEHAMFAADLDRALKQWLYENKWESGRIRLFLPQHGGFLVDILRFENEEELCGPVLRLDELLGEGNILTLNLVIPFISHGGRMISLSHSFELFSCTLHSGRYRFF